MATKQLNFSAEEINELLQEVKDGTTIIVDDMLSTESENPVQNKVISEEIVRLSQKVFPLTLSVSGGSTYEKGTSQSVTVRCTVKEGDTVVTPDTVTVNNESVTNTDTNKVFTNVTTTCKLKKYKSNEKKTWLILQEMVLLLIRQQDLVIPL